MKFSSGERLDNKMTRIRKRSPSITEQLSKQMARILYNTLIREVQQANTAEMVTSSNGVDPQTQDIINQSRPLKVMEAKEYSTWRIAFHKRDLNTLWLY